ncbi:hypothetical protein CHUAL_012979 [Chamberlinius hualienensis]
MSLKILVSGDVDGNFDELFKRVNLVNKKNGPFEMLLCIGNFFGSRNESWRSYTTDSIKKVPITTYILGPNKEDHVVLYPDGLSGDLCENVSCLGKLGLFTGRSGLRIAYISGNEGKNSSSYEFCYDDIDQFCTEIINRSGFEGVDILLSSQWPKLVTNYTNISPTERKESGSEFVSDVAVQLKPRYHFAATEGIYYERQPYRNHKILAEGAKQVTRFIALSKVGNPSKQKWLYAFSIIPMTKIDRKELIKQPEDVTECPYVVVSKPKVKKNEEKSQQFFYDLESGPETKMNKGKRRAEDHHQERRQPKRQTIPPSSDCWFCLSSPKVEKHLVVSVGTHNYMALAKGGLVDDHILILPIGHCQSTVLLEEESLEELERFKSCLRKMFKSQKKTAVFFERNYKGFHLQIQVIPLPENKEPILKQTFMDIADCQSLTLNEIPAYTDLKQIVQPAVPYFYVELPKGEKLFHRIKGSFPLQFGREVLASPPLLNVPDRVDWRACPLSKEEETRLCNTFRKAFEPFDFT